MPIARGYSAHLNLFYLRGSHEQSNETLIQFSKGPCPSMKSLRWPFSSSPIGVSRESSSLAILILACLHAMPSFRAGSRPISLIISRVVRTTC